MFSIPVSNGEIIDKITILKIKLLKVKDPVKLQNIKKVRNQKFLQQHPNIKK